MEIVDAQTNDTATGADTQQRPEPMTPERVRAIAAEILQKNDAKESRSHVEQVIEELVADGYSPEAIKKIVKLRDAERKDEEAKRAKEKQAEQFQAFNSKLWETADNAIAEFEKAVPLVNRPGVRQDLLNEMSGLFKNSEDFKAAREELNSGRVPSKEHYRKAAQVVIDKLCEENGIGKRSGAAQPDLSGSTPTASKAASGQTFEQLNELDRKRARGLMNTGMFTEQEAVAQVLKNKVAS